MSLTSFLSARRPAWSSYLFACVVTLLALEARLLLLDGILQTHVPFLFFYISLAASAWYGGLGPGMFATLAGAVAGVYYFMAPAHSFRYENSLDHLETCTFILTGFLVSYLYHSLLEKKRDLEAEMKERKRVQGALTEADKRKDEFLATLAHELRNPLAPVRNAIELLRRCPEGRIFDAALDIIERQILHMVHLIDDLMDVSRITQGKVILRMQKVLLSDILNCAVESVRPLMEEKRQLLRSQPGPRSAFVNGDTTRLVQIFTNILSNASKYTEPEGVITLDASVEGEEVQITVGDTGAGIPAEMLPKVFNLFEQEKAIVERSRGGLGIGLNLVKRFVEMHGGAVAVRSEGSGKGSVFTVRLPLSVDTATHMTTPAPETKRSPAEAKRVLVVDDSIDSAQTLSWLLETMDCNVRLAKDGPTALEIARDFRPQYVFLDIGLPGMDGYKVGEALRLIPTLKNTIIVAETGYGQPRDRDRSYAAGFDEHLVKPVTMDQLKKILTAPAPLRAKGASLPH